jgi:hypothetical protein
MNDKYIIGAPMNMFTGVYLKRCHVAPCSLGVLSEKTKGEARN